jgi:hypothetical protein
VLAPRECMLDRRPLGGAPPRSSSRKEASRSTSVGVWVGGCGGGGGGGGVEMGRCFRGGGGPDVVWVGWRGPPCDRPDELCTSRKS